MNRMQTKHCLHENRGHEKNPEKFGGHCGLDFCSLTYSVI